MHNPSQLALCYLFYDALSKSYGKRSSEWRTENDLGKSGREPRKKKKTVTVEIIAGDSKQALPNTSVELPQHYLFLLQPPVHYCPCMYYTGSLFWQLTVATSCWFVFRINVAHTADRTHTRCNRGWKWQTITKLITIFLIEVRG